MHLQHSTGPLPNTAQIRLAAELAALVGYRNRVPVFETYVGPFKVNEEIVWVESGTSGCARVAI